MRLIDVDAFKNDYRMADECKDCQTPVRTCECDRVYTKMNFCVWLDSAPTIIPEQKRGQWINAYPDIEPNPMFMYGICSVCGYEQAISNKLNFCPNCGADMRGEADG